MRSTTRYECYALKHSFTFRLDLAFDQLVRLKLPLLFKIYRIDAVR